MPLPLSHKAQVAVPEIAAWLEDRASDPLRTDAAKDEDLRAVIALLRRETGQPTLDDTIDLFHAAGPSRWTWGAYSPSVWEEGPVRGGPPRSWRLTITEHSTGQTFDVSHTGMLAGMRRIVENHDTAIAEGNAALTHAEVALVANVLGASNRSELDDALAEMFERLCLVIVQFAAFGEYRYPMTRLGAPF